MFTLKTLSTEMKQGGSNCEKFINNISLVCKRELIYYTIISVRYIERSVDDKTLLL